MVLEITCIDIKPGLESAFEESTREAFDILRRARGCLGIRLYRCIEQPSRYRLLVDWGTLENHTVDFQQSDDFLAWRALLGPFFEKIPDVEHARLAFDRLPRQAG